MAKKVIIKLHESTGDLFEETFTEKVGQFALKTWGKGAITKSTIWDDQHQGKDFTLLGVPIDPTLNFNEKRKMKKLSHSIQLDWGRVRFGIRYGNGNVTFDKPVLVIGLETEHFPKSMVPAIVSMLEDRLDEILNVGMDLYCEAVDA